MPMLLPATVVMIPSGETLRTTLLSWSAIRKPPSGVVATLGGRFSSAVLAGWPSPVYPAVLLPATVEMSPVAPRAGAASAQATAAIAAGTVRRMPTPSTVSGRLDPRQRLLQLG